EKAAHDINICALSGVSDQMGSGDCGPALSNFQVADIAGGALPAINAILTALFHRERTGKGAFLDISMAGSLFASNVLPYATRETFKRSPERGGDILTGALACYGYYETSDGGWIAVGALEPQFWERFCNLIDRPDLIPARLSLDGATKEAVREIIKSKPKGAWIELLEGTDCCVTPVLTYGEAASQMALTETNSVVIPDPIDGDLSQPINCWNNEGTKPAVRAPRHGEHSRAILLSFGITERNINGFVEDGLIAEPEVSTAD
ncbi:MAG: CoA transferase, partial [Pseudomonadota bacterium]